MCNEAHYTKDQITLEGRQQPQHKIKMPTRTIKTPKPDRETKAASEVTLITSNLIRIPKRTSLTSLSSKDPTTLSVVSWQTELCEQCSATTSLKPATTIKPKVNKMAKYRTTTCSVAIPAAAGAAAAFCAVNLNIKDKHNYHQQYESVHRTHKDLNTSQLNSKYKTCLSTIESPLEPPLASSSSSSSSSPTCYSLLSAIQRTPTTPTPPAIASTTSYPSLVLCQATRELVDAAAVVPTRTATTNTKTSLATTSTTVTTTTAQQKTLRMKMPLRHLIVTLMAAIVFSMEFTICNSAAVIGQHLLATSTTTHTLLANNSGTSNKSIQNIPVASRGIPSLSNELNQSSLTTLSTMASLILTATASSTTTAPAPWIPSSSSLLASSLPLSSASALNTIDKQTNKNNKHKEMSSSILLAPSKTLETAALIDTSPLSSSSSSSSSSSASSSISSSLSLSPAALSSSLSHNAKSSSFSLSSLMAETATPFMYKDTGNHNSYSKSNSNNFEQYYSPTINDSQDDFSAFPTSMLSSSASADDVDDDMDLDGLHKDETTDLPPLTAEEQAAKDLLTKGFSIPTYLPPFPVFAVADLPAYLNTVSTTTTDPLLAAENEQALDGIDVGGNLHANLLFDSSPELRQHFLEQQQKHRKLQNSIPKRNSSTAALANVTVQMGNHAYMPCHIHRLQNKPVSWVRLKDGHIISVDQSTFIADQRFQAIYQDDKEYTWSLQIKYVQETDEGWYDCQVSSEPRQSAKIFLKVIVPITELIGDQSRFVKAGSKVALHCLVRGTLDPPQYIIWLRDKTQITDGNKMGWFTQLDRNIFGNSGGDNQNTIGSLIIPFVRKMDSGNYTCQPSNSASVSVDLHVLSGEYSASAIMSAARTYKLNDCYLLLLLLLLSLHKT